MTKMRTKTYHQLISEVRSFDNIKVPNELKHPPSLDVKYRKGLERLLRNVDKLNNNQGDRDTETMELATNSMDLIVALIDGQIDNSLQHKHLIRVKNAKIDSLEKLLNPKPKKKKGKGGSDSDLQSLKDSIG